MNLTLKYEESFTVAVLVKIRKFFKYFLYSMGCTLALSESCCMHLEAILFWF